MLHHRRLFAAVATSAILGAAAVALPGAGAASGAATVKPAAPAIKTIKPVLTTPIKHVVVIFGENISFDHYFGTYPKAANADGQPFTAKKKTPAVDGLSGTLLTANPNGVNPKRYDPTNVNDVLTCDENHGYTAEQSAFDHGLMDKFPASVGTGTGVSPTGQACAADDVMNYYDGNTVTGLWNYAQHFAMSDSSFGTTFGPSSPGAINLVSGDTGGVDTAHSVRGVLPVPPATVSDDVAADGTGGFSLIGDAQPYYDDCSNRDAVALTGTNIGDRLNAASLSWGWFEGGFAPTSPYTGPATTASNYDQLNVTGRAVCGATHNVGVAVGGTGQFGTKADYIPHHEPFEYYASTANPHHLAPKSLSVVGKDTATPGKFNTANHNYDMSTFDALVAAIHGGALPANDLPAVSFLKAPGYQDAHAGYSDPFDEQEFVVSEINALEQLPTWSSTAVILAYDDSDGWYDHAFSGVTNPSQTAADTLTGTNQCGAATSYLGNEQGRCGYGPRMPLMVISPLARSNYVSNQLTDLSSIVRFVEHNWTLGQIPGSAANVAGSLDDMFNFTGAKRVTRLFLDPATGERESAPVPNTPEAGNRIF